MSAFAGVAIACGAKSEPVAATPTVATSTVPTPESAALGRGAALYAQTCATCHGDREGKGGIPGAPTHNDTGHTWHHPEAQLRDWVLNGKFGFSKMPPQRDSVTDEELELILKYVKTWWTADQRAFQEDVSRRYQEALERSK